MDITDVMLNFLGVQALAYFVGFGLLAAHTGERAALGLATVVPALVVGLFTLDRALF